MGLHLPDNANVILKVNDFTLYNQQELKLLAARQENLLNLDQKQAYESVLQSVRAKSGKCFFLDAPGGTGKTFLLNLFLAKIRSEGFIAIAVASSGLAATLLDGWRTAHSMFKLPLNVFSNDSAVCNTSKQSDTAKILQKCSLIVWDESTMSHKTSMETLDRTLKDLRNNNKLMGGITVLFSGDFRQTLPAIPKRNRADEVNACLKRSYIWCHVKKLSLTINMRSRIFPDGNKNFANQLLKLGNGTFELHDGQISLNNSNLCVNVNDIEDLVKAVYPDISSLSHRPLTWFAERAILALRNDAVESINDLILTKFDAESHAYMSVDVVMDEDEAVHYPTEFLNSINLPDLPSHKLILKVGAPIILLLNLKPPKLCKGTRLKVVTLNKHLIEAVVISGCGTGEKYMIPRIPLISSNLPFTFKRLQFPIRLCFAMTINRAQGQTLKIACINLSSPCFSHGQIYVAFSRVGSPRNLYVLAPNYKTKNIVYQEALA